MAYKNEKANKPAETKEKIIIQVVEAPKNASIIHRLDKQFKDYSL